MMNKNQILRTVFLGLAIIASNLAIAQAVLPTTWGFDTATPTGWTESLGTGNTRYANGFSGQACRLDGTGDYVLIEFAEEPGQLSYYIKGQNSGGTWQGTFTIEESVDGVSFTPLNALVNGDLPSTAFTLFNSSPAADTRFIRFYFTNKVSGHNVALDDVTLATPIAGDSQEINVTQNGNNVPSGSTFVSGNAPTVDFVIENIGLATDLTISDIIISGPDAADFSLSAIPTTIAAGSSSTITLTFSGTGEGSRFCTIDIANDDASESNYLINIYAIAGALASEPTSGPSNVSFSGINAWDYNVIVSEGAPAADAYLVLRKKGTIVTDAPVDGTTYVRGEWLGESQVVYNGEAASFNARSVETSTTYYYKVFAYNGPSGYENYSIDLSGSASVTTGNPTIGNYYQGVDHNAPTFVTDLQEALYPGNYFQVFYSNYISTLINEFYVADTAVAGVSNNMVKCSYSDEAYIYPAGFQFWDGNGPGSLSREHCYPQSWMPTYFDAGFDDSDEVSDLHNLLPVLQEECNAVRSNYPYGEVVAPSSAYLTTSYGENALGQTVYEPGDAIKGDAARAIMYHAAKNNIVGEDFSLPEQISLIIPYGQDEKVIKQWHFQDLPTNAEMARNEYIFTRQNNRNAFIDSVQFPCYIRFSNLTKWQPIALYDGSELECIDLGLSYQWYMDGEAIEGATSATYNPTENGNYTVVMQQFEECPAFESVTATVTNIGVEETQSTMSMNVYPNPSNGNVTITLESDNVSPILISVMDMSGKMIAQTYVVPSNTQTTVPMNLPVAAGIYLVEAESSFGVHTTKLIIE